MVPLHALMCQPVSRRIMLAARAGTRPYVAFALAAVLGFGTAIRSTSAKAGESMPAVSNGGTVPEKNAGSDPAPVSAGASTPDSVVAATATHDSSSAPAQTEPAGAKSSPPAEHADHGSENAAAARPTEKPPDAPPGAAKHIDADLKAAPPAQGEAAAKPSAKAPIRGRKVSVRKGKAPVKPGSGTAAKPPTTPTNPKTPAVESKPPEVDRAGAELNRTDRFLAGRERSVMLSKNTRAIKLFASALDFQADSRDAFKVRQYARAQRLSLAAREFADRASRMVGPPREDPDYVERVLRRTDDALDRAKDVLQTGAGPVSWKRHEDLKSGQKDAWKTFKGGDVGSAYKQTLGVRDGVLGLLRDLQDLPVPRVTAEKAIGGAQAAFDQASKELGPKPNGEAGRFVRLASEYLSKARQSFSRGSYRSALLQAKVVERHLERAVDAGRSRPGT